jgi:hypothetical protein
MQPKILFLFPILTVDITYQAYNFQYECTAFSIDGPSKGVIQMPFEEHVQSARLYYFLYFFHSTPSPLSPVS